MGFGKRERATDSYIYHKWLLKNHQNPWSQSRNKSKIYFNTLRCDIFRETERERKRLKYTQKERELNMIVIILEKL